MPRSVDDLAPYKGETQPAGKGFAQGERTIQRFQWCSGACPVLSPKARRSPVPRFQETCLYSRSLGDSHRGGDPLFESLGTQSTS